MDKDKGLTKVLLIVPNFRWRSADSNIVWHYIPYNLCMLASMIEHDYKVKIIDANKDDLSIEELSAQISAFMPDVVGFGVLMDYFGKTAHIVADIVKKIDRKITTIIGGVYASTNVDKVMQDHNIDYLIAGEGEYAFKAILLALKNQTSLNVAGIYYRKEEKIVGSGVAEYIEDLDKLPLPAYHLIDFPAYARNIERKSVDRPFQLPYARIITSRGCTFQCCFCQVHSIIGGKFRARSAENVLQEIDWLIKEYGVKSIIFDDDNLFIDKARAKDILRGLLERKLTHKSMNVAAFLLDDEMLELLKASGCNQINLAIETGTERVMKEIINKPLELEQAKKVVKKARELGMYVVANFIVGFPGESWEEILATIKFVEELDADYSKIANAVPLPHTKMFDVAQDMNAIIAGYDSENIDWRRGWIETEEFTANDLTILRAYEWDRINFTCPEKREKTRKMMDMTIEELNDMRKHTRKQASKLIVAEEN